MKWFSTNETTRRRLVNGVLQEGIIDQVLYKNEALVIEAKLLGRSDHISMQIELGVSLEEELLPEINVIKKPNWSKVSITDILNYSYENINWDSSSGSLNVEEIWNQLHGKLCTITKIAPIMRCDANNRPLNPPWSNTSLKRMRRYKDHA